MPAGLCLRCLLEIGLKAGNGYRREPSESADIPSFPPDEETFDRYHVVRKIGEGGCGVVYQAEQLVPVRRAVAIKVIKLGMDTQAVIARFEAERQALALMDHPHIAKVLDAGTTHNGRPFFVMELVGGKPITEFCNEHVLSIRQRLRLFIQVCQAVQHAHQKGIIHRDLKPSNILVVEQDGKPTSKVIDFGVATATTRQRLADQTIYTAFDQFVGTPAYMSPEQTTMASEDVDTRSDIYSLGVLLYELLTDRPPFEPERLRRVTLDEICRIIREEEAPLPSARLSTLSNEELSETAQRRQLPASKLISELRGDLDWLTMKAMEKDRSRRYDTAVALAEDLQRHLANEPILARPPSAIYRLKKMARRNRLALSATAAVAFALIAGLAISTGMYFKEKQARQRLEYRAYLSDMDLAARMATERVGGLEGTERLLESWRRHRPDFRNWEWYYLNGLCHHDLLTIRADSNGLWSVSWSPDGKYLATGGAGNAVKIWDAVTGQLLASLRGHTNSVLAVAWSPNGRWLASGSADKTIRIWNPKTGDSTILRGNRGSVTCLAWSPNSTEIASGCSDGTVCIWNALTRTTIRIFKTGKQVLSVSWNNDGTRLVAAGDGHLLTTWNVSRGQKLWSLPLNHESPYRIVAAWSPDGKLVATGADDYSVSFRDALTGKNLISFWDNYNVVLSVAWSPDGTHLASATSGDGRIDIRDMQAGGKIERDFRGHLGSVRSICWRPDGKEIASASTDGTVKVWDVNGGDPSVINLLQPDQATFLQWSPDGTKLAAGCRRMGPWIWDLSEGGAPIALSDGYTAWTWAVAWNSDGTRLASAGTDGVNVWDTKRLVKVWHYGKGSYNAIAWSPDFKKVAAVAYNIHEINILNSMNGELLKTIDCPASGSLTWSPDGRSLAAGVGSRIYVWNAATLALKNILVGHTATVACLAWSPDGTRLASGSDDDTAKIWDVKRGSVITTLFGHTAPVHSVAWSPDGTRVVTGSADMSVKIWDPVTGQEVCSFNKPGRIVQPIYSVAWSSDGRRIACSDLEGNICILDSTPGRIDKGAAKIRYTLDKTSQTRADTIQSLKLYCETVEPHTTNNADALRRLAWIMATCRYPELRNGPKAVAFARQAVALNGGQNPVLLNILAAAYAEDGDFSKAIEFQKRAMTLMPTVELREDYATELKLYEAHKPYRDDSW